MKQNKYIEKINGRIKKLRNRKSKLCDGEDGMEISLINSMIRELISLRRSMRRIR
jgi:hypothetical protein